MEAEELEAELDGTFHIYPTDDIAPHLMSSHCWCQPVFDVYENVLHHKLMVELLQ